MGLAPALTGCVSRTHSVPKTRPAEVVLDATLDQLLNQVNERYQSIQTMSASVEIAASTGGGEQGQVKDYTSLSGYLFMRKPESMRVIMLVPVVRTRAVDMVSNGDSFKLYIPSRNKAIVGTNEVTNPSKNGLENLRPAVFFDSLFVQGVSADQLVSQTSDIRVVQGQKKNDLIEEPDYDLEILAPPQGRTVRTLRVIHISRATLLPYQQDIYDTTGHVVTRAFYSDYQKYGDIPFPGKIIIKRPLDQYTLALTITKLTLNQPLEDDQFELKIPDNVPVQKMN
jgi:outer membrane lipoprotein-sorting protein